MTQRRLAAALEEPRYQYPGGEPSRQAANRGDDRFTSVRFPITSFRVGGGGDGRGEGAGSAAHIAEMSTAAARMSTWSIHLKSH